jgi:hypothetical protein
MSRPICGAKKKNGEPCQCTAVMASGRCRVHGGATPRGIASPHFRTGRHSKSLPARLGERYQEARQDAKLLELRDEIALTDARLAELLGRLGTGESGAGWANMRVAFNLLRTAINAGDVPGSHSALAMMERTLSEGDDDAVWVSINEQVEQRRKLVESERKQLAIMDQFVAVSDAITLASVLLSAVKAHVTEPAALSAIARAFDQAMAHYEA